MSDPDVYARVVAAAGVVSKTADPSVVARAMRELSRVLEEMGSDDLSRHTALFVLAGASMRLYAR